MFYSSHIGLFCLYLILFMYLTWHRYFCLIPYIYFCFVQYALLLTCSISCLLFLLWIYGTLNKINSIQYVTIYRIHEIKWNANSSAWQKFWNKCNNLSILILFFRYSSHQKSHIKPQTVFWFQNTIPCWLKSMWSSLCTTTLHSSLVPTKNVLRLKLTEINISHSGLLVTIMSCTYKTHVQRHKWTFKYMCADETFLH
jgi:hypothetical protein